MNSHILVVDDEEQLCETIKDVLDFYFEKRVAVSIAHNFREALQKIQEIGNFDLIISDVQMPEMKGSDLVSLIHKILPQAEILMITGAPESIEAYDKELFNRVNSEKFGFLEKPISNEVLFRSVRRSLRIIELEKSNNALFSQLSRSSELGEAMLAHGHDLKNIIGASTMGIESILMPDIQEAMPETQKKHELLGALSDMHVTLGQAQELIKALLTANRSDNNNRSLPIFDLVDQAIIIAVPYAKKAQVDWKLSPNYFGEIVGTNSLINVFVNLIKNAIESFTNSKKEEKKLIDIAIEEEAENIVVSVKDNGSGIEDSILNDLNKGNKVSTKGENGNGHGVSGARRLLQGMGAKLLIASEFGKGSEFSVVLKKRA